mgnify:FL=1
MIDTWKVRYNTDPDAVGNAVDDVNKLNDPYIGTTITKVAAEIGITL